MNTTAESNGHSDAHGSEGLKLRTMSMVVNLLQARRAFIDKLTERRRNISEECDYPDPVEVKADTYQDLYDWEAIPARVVDVLPRESWQVTPSVYESEDTDTLTPFEQAWNDLPKALRGGQSWYAGEDGNPIWETLLKVDIGSGIGSWGIVVLGVNDGKPLSMPLEGVVDPNTNDTTASSPQAPTVTRTTPYSESTGMVGSKTTAEPTPSEATKPTGTKGDGTKTDTGTTSSQGSKPRYSLTFLRVFKQNSVTISRSDTTPGSPRRGMPVEYEVTFSNPLDNPGGLTGVASEAVKVHWTRVLHVADNTLESEWCGTPRMQPVLRRLLDLRKLYSGSAEMYWQGALPGWSIETNPQLGADVEIDKQAVKEMVEDWREGLQRVITLEGMSAKSLAPQVVDPGTQIKVQLEAICIRLGIPMRIFLGSERGELASSQDDSAWNDRLKSRQCVYITPRIICPLVDRLIACGVLPEPVDGYQVHWPDLTSKSDQEKATTAVAWTQCLATFVSGNCESVFPLQYFLTMIMDLSDDEANEIIDEATKIVQEQEQAAAEKALADQQAAIDAAKASGQQVDQNGNPVPVPTNPTPAPPNTNNHLRQL